MRRLCLLVGLLALNGCAGTFDLMYLLSGPKGDRDSRTALRETDPTQRWRAVSFDKTHGLVCEEIEQSSGSGFEQRVETENPNGWLTTTWAGTLVDGAITTAVILLEELSCREEKGGPCVDRTVLYPAFTPIFASLAWGIYRSLTIHPETFLQGDIVPVTGTPEPFSAPCEMGTVVTLQSGTQTYDVSVDEGGYARGEFRLGLFAFLEEAATIRVAASSGLETRLDAQGGRDFVAAVRAEIQAAERAAHAIEARESAERARRAEQPSQQPSPVVVPAGGVRIDVEIGGGCRSDADCPATQTCRSDGILIRCMPR